jgi:translocator protein
MNQYAPGQQSHNNLLRLAMIYVPLVLLLGIASGRLSNSGYGNPWFDALVKPEAMPPGWVFGVAWTTLYILLGLALALVLATPRTAARDKAVGLFVLQLVLNYSWSPLFFAAHEVRIALNVITGMVVIAGAAAYLFNRIRPAAALLMLPYLAWLIFACWLNFQILLLNPGAESLV